MPPPEVMENILKKYPKPAVDPEWLDGCYTWVTGEKNLNPETDLDQILDEVETQLLASDLRDSMLHGSGIPERIANADTEKSQLTGPILVQIVSITDIGVSAYNLNKTRQTREERFAAGEREEGEGDDEVEDEGPIPEYTRSMLRFEISDGSTTIRAMEYRKIPELKLGQTPLGYKLLIHNAEVRRGIAFLEPKNITLKGSEEFNLEERQHAQFANSLRERLGLPPDEDQENQNPPAPRQNANHVRSPLRDISPPPSPTLPVDQHVHIDDEDQPRRRRIPNPPQQTPPLSTSTTQTQTRTQTPSQYASTSRGPIDIESDEEEEDENGDWKENTRNRPVKPLPARSRLSTGSSGMPMPKPNSPVKTSTNKKSFDDDDDFFDDEFDAEFLAGVDEAELNAMGAQFQRMGTPSKATRSQPDRSQASTSGPRPSQRLPPVEVETITITDDDEEDKENVPAPSRHVRRRTLPSNPVAVIVLSDSD